MTTKNYQYRYRKPRSAPEERGGRPPVYRRILENEHAMIIERDVAIRMRDGVTLYADVFRPPTSVRFRRSSPGRLMASTCHSIRDGFSMPA